MRCKNCKDKFEAIHFNQKYCSKPECMEVWISKAKATQWKVKKRSKEVDGSPINWWEKEAYKK